VTAGSLSIGVTSELAALRYVVEAWLELTPMPLDGREALFVGRPAAATSVGTAAWVLYESGDIVLRRSRDENDVVLAACYHVHSLRMAIESDLLAVRLRPIVLPNDTVLLVPPAVVHDLAGHDRRLLAKGGLVLPTTIALIDPESAVVVLPEHDLDTPIPGGRRAIAAVLLTDRNETQLQGAAEILGLCRAAVRAPDRDLQATLDQILRLARTELGLVTMLDNAAIMECVNRLGVPATT
jgi:hypothetical protein